jgi:polyhydroxybutyrate depolymerase
MSNGALLCYLLAARLSTRIAAIAAVACAAVALDWQPTRAMPVIHLHGTQDEFVPYQGGAGSRSFAQTEFFSVTETVEFWATYNECDFPPTIDDIHGNDDGTHVRRSVYPNGRDGSEVQLVTIEGAGHTWPGHPSKHVFLGRTTSQIDANEVIWEFLQRFQR